MKRSIIVLLAASFAVFGMVGTGHASTNANTVKGPYGPNPVGDGGTCGNIWANDNVSSTYYVSPISNDGTYNVRVKVAGTFLTVEGTSPGACGTGSDNGNTIINNVKGHLKNLFYISVAGGTFDPNQTCDSSCGTFNGGFTGIDTFVSTFFGNSASWSFSAVKDGSGVYTSHNSVLCANSWTETFNEVTFAITSSTGDIATHCAA